MSIIGEILEELLETERMYKGTRVNIFGIPSFKNYSKRTLRSTVDRLAKNDLVRKELNGLILTSKGKRYLQRKADSLESFSATIPLSSPKDLFVMFDVPVSRKAEREWLRFHLKKFGYVMVQKSVWVGPSPLPKEFVAYLNRIKLKDCIKTFKLAKPYKG